MSALNFSNAVEITNTPYTTTKKGSIIGSINLTSGMIDLIVDSKNLYHNSNLLASANITYIPAGTTIQLSAVNNSACKIWFVPYSD